MNKKQIALAVVLCDLVALTLYAVAQYGVAGLFVQVTANAATWQVLADLTIALSLVMVWMWQDARRLGIAPLPYVLLTCALGSIGPLLYLIRRFGHDPAIVSTQAPLGAYPSRARA